jgi:DNA-binding NarL/FixJ family response regulator
MAGRIAGGTMGRMQTILIVDDHASFRAAARALLERGGFEVVGEAGEGLGAVEAVHRLRPDIVLLDVQLPGDDGFVTCERILDASDGVGVPAPVVVLTSARPLSTFRRRLAGSRASGFIPKTDLTASGLAALVTGA